MLKKKSFYIIVLILGIILLCISFLLKGEELKLISGLFMGIGAGLFGMSIANIVMKNIEEKNPEAMKQKEIEFKDERNTIIRNRAKAKAGDIIHWCIMGLAYITIIIKAQLWVTFITIFVCIFYHILSAYFMIKYRKEM
jgi:hypothetical protein